MTPANQITDDDSRSFLGMRDVSDRELESKLMQEIVAQFGTDLIESVGQGDIIFREGEILTSLIFVQDGRVQLYRNIDDREIIFHRHSTGRVLGLLSAFKEATAFFSCRATTATTLIRIPLADLERRMAESPRLSALVTTTALRSQARRSRRAAELQIELEQAQMRLVENEKMATLGQLSAGVAHELNNPIAAIARAADHLSADVVALTGALSHDTAAEDSLRRGLTSTPLDTREERTLIRALAEHLGDAHIARRLVRIGLHTKADIRNVFGDDLRGDTKHQHEERLKIIEWCFQIGASLRNTKSCASRIADLVSSLRSYGRPDQTTTDGVDIHRGIEETILLLGHKLRNIDIIKSFAQLPTITCRPSELNQVWTNLLSNAIEALSGRGVIRIVTHVSEDTSCIHVDIIDDGPGIPKVNLSRVFDVNFTTRQGLAGFGLGIGLPICREIIARHDGSITATSEPGRTCFRVTIPTNPVSNAKGK